MNRRRRILFLCTANCCRSQMAEAILKHIDGDHFEALSAGADPSGYVHPVVEAALEPMGIPVQDQHSKSWDQFRDQPIDLMITVCASAANEVCPLWIDGPPTVHWPLPDPIAGDDPVESSRRVAERLLLKIRQMVALDWKQQDATTLKPALQAMADL